MGLFSSIFGSGGSDKADKLRQQAMDAFNSIKTPELAALQVQLDKYVQAGQLTPEQAETQLLGSNAFNAIATDPSYVDAQKQALQQLQAVATQGGMTAIDRAQLQDITDQQNQQNKSQNEATMQQAQQRGVGGSDLTAVNQLINEQGNADRASRAGTDVAANAQQRALQAMQAAGQTGSALESQQYGEAANKANAANAIDVFNKQALNQTNLYNTQTSNAAQAANLANAQAVGNANTQTSNANKEYNAAQNQTVFNDQLQKAQGISNVDTTAANAAQKAALDERNASAGLISGAVQGGATALGAAFGGPAGAVAANSMTANGGKSNPNINESDLPGYFEGGDVTDPEHPDHMSAGGHVHCYAHGGEAFHHPDCMAKGGDVEKKTPPLEITPTEQPGFEAHESTWTLKDPKGEPIGTFKDYAEAAAYEQKVREKQPETKDFRKGGAVPGKAKVKGDSPKNDTVDAKLSPGEIVVPRSAASDEEEFKNFMAKFEPTKKMASGGMVPGIPRVNDMNPMRNTVRSPVANPVPLAATNDANDFTHMMSTFKPKKLPKQPKAPVRVPPEVSALSNLHQRVSRLEGGKI